MGNKSFSEIVAAISLPMGVAVVALSYMNVIEMQTAICLILKR